MVRCKRDYVAVQLCNFCMSKDTNPQQLWQCRHQIEKMPINAGGCIANKLCSCLNLASHTGPMRMGTIVGSRDHERRSASPLGATAGSLISDHGPEMQTAGQSPAVLRQNGKQGIYPRTLRQAPASISDRSRPMSRSIRLSSIDNSRTVAR